ncbi:MAG: ORF6N domain-containing protein [Planctomycetes bacterium]|nr:ORF6N domain-containing protein [Planctomycetota bacterium]
MEIIVQQEVIEGKIYMIRGHKVMLDSDLAELYAVPTKRLNEQVRRNITRFPSDFMFQLSEDEAASLRSQFATLKKGRGEPGAASGRNQIRNTNIEIRNNFK